MAISERLRWEELAPRGRGRAPTRRTRASASGARSRSAPAPLLGAGLQIAAFRIGPIVIAKEAGLDGRRLHRRRRGDPAGAAARDAAAPERSSGRSARSSSTTAPSTRRSPPTRRARRSPPSAAAGFSRFHPRCGTSFLVVSAMVSIVVYGAVLAITGVFTYLGADRHPPDRRAGRHGHRLRAPAPGLASRATGGCASSPGRACGRRS